MRQNSVMPTPAARSMSAASGMRTISESAVSVMPSATPNPGSALWSRRSVRATMLMALFSAVQLIERPAIREMDALRVGPTAERLVDRDHFQHRKLPTILRVGVLRGHWPQMVFCDRSLTGGCVEELQIRLGGLLRSARPGVAIDDGDRRFGEDRQRGCDDLEFVLAE